jgi:osmotically-inducible protein OsmY
MGNTRDVREAVEKELSYDPRVDATDISVKNINGKVALTGTVPSYPQYLEAARAAWRVGGVTGVSNHLEVMLPPSAVRDDAMLTTAANNALAADATVPDGIEATAKNGDLTLTGTVQYLSQRPAVEKVVSGLIGVRHVRNEIGVVSGVEPTDVKLLVRKALDRSALVPDDSDVQVETSGSTVILTGHVRTRAERDAIVGATWMARGVAMVVDELEVTG